MSLTSIHNTLDEDGPVLRFRIVRLASSAPVIFAGVVMQKNELLPVDNQRQQILSFDRLSATGCSLYCFFKVAPVRRELFAREMTP